MKTFRHGERRYARRVLTRLPAGRWVVGPQSLRVASQSRHLQQIVIYPTKIVYTRRWWLKESNALIKGSHTQPSIFGKSHQSCHLGVNEARLYTHPQVCDTTRSTLAAGATSVLACVCAPGYLTTAAVNCEQCPAGYYQDEKVTARCCFKLVIVRRTAEAWNTRLYD
jgi:hypothetical protein